uniref:Uncharacterized protein n=1 Tax=Romanomermis culicivorax TaxID=13658 RepID=A0A915IXP0_ROMCU
MHLVSLPTSNSVVSLTDVRVDADSDSCPGRSLSKSDEENENIDELTDAATTNRNRNESESAATSLTNNFNTIDDLEMFFNNHDNISNSVINSDNSMWTLDAHFNQNSGLQYPLTAEQQHLSPKAQISFLVGTFNLEQPQTEYVVQSETTSKTFQPNVNVLQNGNYAKNEVKTASQGVKAYASPSPYAAQKQFTPPAVSSSSSVTFCGQQQLQARFAPGLNLSASLQNGGGIGRSMTNLTSSSASNPIVRGISASYTNVYSSMNGPNRSSTIPVGRKRPLNPIKVRELQ